MSKYLLVRHNVKDYRAWKKVFDENIPPRQDYGLGKGQILCTQSDPCNVFVLFEVSDIDLARKFMSLPELKTVMDRAGVTETPEVYYLREPESVQIPAGATVGTDWEEELEFGD